MKNNTIYYVSDKLALAVESIVGEPYNLDLIDIIAKVSQELSSQSKENIWIKQELSEELVDFLTDNKVNTLIYQGVVAYTLNNGVPFVDAEYFERYSYGVMANTIINAALDRTVQTLFHGEFTLENDAVDTPISDADYEHDIYTFLISEVPSYISNVFTSVSNVLVFNGKDNELEKQISTQLKDARWRPFVTHYSYANEVYIEGYLYAVKEDAKDFLDPILKTSFVLSAKSKADSRAHLELNTVNEALSTKYTRPYIHNAQNLSTVVPVGTKFTLSAERTKRLLGELADYEYDSVEFGILFNEHRELQMYSIVTVDGQTRTYPLASGYHDALYYSLIYEELDFEGTWLTDMPFKMQYVHLDNTPM